MRKYIIILSGVLAVVFGYISYVNSDKNDWYTSEKPVRCEIINKDVRMYNASSSKVADIRYKNVFVCKTPYGFTNITVGDELYYSTKQGQVLKFNLSLQDINGPYNPNLDSSSFLWCVGSIILGLICLFTFINE